MTTVIDEVGGLVNARSVGALPKSREQVSYYKSKAKSCSSSNTGKSEDVLYSVMLQCKSSDASNAFVRAVVAAPEPMAVLCTDQQLDDMVRFLTNPADFSIMGVDPTFNFGDFNVSQSSFAAPHQRAQSCHVRTNFSASSKEIFFL